MRIGLLEDISVMDVNTTRTR